MVDYSLKSLKNFGLGNLIGICDRDVINIMFKIIFLVNVEVLWVFFFKYNFLI